MGLLSKLLNPQKSTQLSQQAQYERKVIYSLAKKTSEIQEGLSKPFAGTGISMDKLKGNARTNALLSNIGGGSKANGGKGVQGGVQKIVEKAEMIGRLKEIQRNKKK